MINLLIKSVNNTGNVDMSESLQVSYYGTFGFLSRGALVSTTVWFCPIKVEDYIQGMQKAKNIHQLQLKKSNQTVYKNNVDTKHKKYGQKLCTAKYTFHG